MLEAAQQTRQKQQISGKKNKNMTLFANGAKAEKEEQ